MSKLVVLGQQGSSYVVTLYDDLRRLQLLAASRKIPSWDIRIVEEINGHYPITLCSVMPKSRGEFKVLNIAHTPQEAWTKQYDLAKDFASKLAQSRNCPFFDKTPNSPKSRFEQLDSLPLEMRTLVRDLAGVGYAAY